jgi:hypothetical protein
MPTETTVIASATSQADDVTLEIVNSKMQIKDGGVGTTQLANNSVTGTKIAMGSDAQGDILYYDGTNYARLGAGTSGQFLKTGGAGANPSWADVFQSGDLLLVQVIDLTPYNLTYHETNSTSYVDFGTIQDITLPTAPTGWTITCKYAFTGRTHASFTDATTSRLYDVTSGSAITGSETGVGSGSTSTSKEVISGELTITSGNSLKVQTKSADASIYVDVNHPKLLVFIKKS